MIFLKSFLLAAAIGLTIVVGIYWLQKGEGFPYSESSAGVQIKLKENTSAAQGSVYTITAGQIDGEAVLNSAPTASLGQSLVNSQIVGVESTFQNSRAPYAGHITALIECNTNKFVKEKIVSFAGAETKLILAVTSGRRIFGVCSIEEVKYASVFWSGYDEQRRQVLTVKLFKPITDPNKIEESQQEIFGIFQKVINHPGGT